MNILVLGAGTFGTAIANELSCNSENNVILFSRNQTKVDEINLLHTNKSCFPNKKLTENLLASSNENEIRDAQIILIALPSSVIIDTLLKLKIYFKQDVLLVNLSKGILPSGKTIVDSIIEATNLQNVVALKGPSFAVELMEHAGTLLTLGYKTEEQCSLINQMIENTSIHLDYTLDIRGVEFLSALKNIYAIFIGVVDARYNSPNTRFMILTKALSEIRIILRTLGGSEDTLFLACGFGDFCLTSLNDLSRNRTLGLFIGKGFFTEDCKSNGVMLEGLVSLDVFRQIFIENTEMDSLPIFKKLYNFFASEKKDFIMDFEEILVNI